MILATYQDAAGKTHLGAVLPDQQQLIDLNAVHTDLQGRPHPALSSMLALIRSGESGLSVARQMQAAAGSDPAWCHALSDVHLQAPLPVPEQIRDFSTHTEHMQNAGAAMARLRALRTGSRDPLPTPADIVLPEVFYQQPVYYKSNRFSVVGHDHDVHWPAYSQLLDYELELCAVIGRKGRDIGIEQARDHIFGYTIFNDFSARDAQEYEMSAPFGPCKGKDFDTGNVFGPWIVTADQLTDPYQLNMVARVNGEEWSRGNSRDMVHSFEAMISHVSQAETLQPGELFGSGTVGRGCGLELDRWLQAGDVVELEVEGIGLLRNRVVRP